MKKYTLRKERYRSPYELEREWDELIDDLWYNEFYFDDFKSTFIATFKLLYPFTKSGMIPAEYMSLILKVHEYAIHEDEAEGIAFSSKLMAQAMLSMVCGEVFALSASGSNKLFTQALRSQKISLKLEDLEERDLFMLLDKTRMIG